MKDNVIRVLLVDDHEVVRAGFRRLLGRRADIQVVGEAARGEEAYHLAGETAPDVVVMDLSMPGMGGLEAIRRILARSPATRILVVSMHEGASFALQALKAGALGYVTKASAAQVLVHAVHEVAEGRNYLGPDTAQAIALHHVKGETNPLAQLTTREFEVFRLLAEGCTPDDIGTRLYLSGKTVANYQTQIRQKLGISSPTELVRLAIRCGVIGA